MTFFQIDGATICEKQGRDAAMLQLACAKRDLPTQQNEKRNMNKLTLIADAGIAWLASVPMFAKAFLSENPRIRIAVLNAAQKTRKSILAFLSAFFLCSVVSGCVTIEKCGLEGCPGDQKITSHVEALLEQHPDLDANLLTVQTLNHVVYLDGLVESDLQSDTAAAIAKHVKGVKEVVNNISVNNN
jgi:hypothetical protein